jgi:hypothetical protein
LTKARIRSALFFFARWKPCRARLSAKEADAALWFELFRFQKSPFEERSNQAAVFFIQTRVGKEFWQFSQEQETVL